MIDLSSDQEKALQNLLDWYHSENKNSYITLGGYAGTGKTTLISVLRHKLNEQKIKLRVAFCAYTGKASRVLRIKLIESKAMFDQDFIGTIHSLIYSPVVDEKTEEIIGWKKKEELEADLIIIDEASMVDSIIWKDLLSYNVRIIAVGDHGQLPPIRGTFNLMENPILKLEEIHRQERENPIINLSIMARVEGKIPFGKFGNNIYKLNNNEVESQDRIAELLQNYNNNTLVLCGYNKTRIKLNNFIRGSFDFQSPFPQTNDRVICLRNNHLKKIYNGMIGTVCKIKEKNENWYKTEIDMDGEEKKYIGNIFSKQFNQIQGVNFTQDRRLTKEGDLFDFGYALTVHKAQGSQAKRVILFEERFSKMDDDQWRRWLYTGVTRAEEELFIVG
jgi:exodeoxyribonuclease-5